MLRDGKENSCERNPGGVSFAFNHRFFELIKFRKSCSSVSKNFFDTLLAAGFSGSQHSLSKKSGWSWAFLIDMVEWAKG